jgi:hypothetical protein
MSRLALAALLLTATAAQAFDAQDQYLGCIFAAAKKLEPSAESAPIVAKAALASCIPEQEIYATEAAKRRSISLVKMRETVREIGFDGAVTAVVQIRAATGR